VSPAAEKIAGFDVAAEGRDLCVLIDRMGPVVNMPVSWAKMNTTQSAHMALDECDKKEVGAMHYDCIGVGEGVRGTLQSTERKYKVIPNPVNVGEKPSETIWGDGKSSREKFKNLKAEIWGIVRQRFEKTWEFVTQGTKHRPEEMISLPDHPQLIAELSQVRRFPTETGKIVMESKEQLARRGVHSPDFAEALVLAFTPICVSYQIGFPSDHQQMDVLHRAPAGVFLGGSGRGGIMTRVPRGVFHGR
jgi:phage terminase large subunit